VAEEAPVDVADGGTALGPVGVRDQEGVQPVRGEQALLHPPIAGQDGHTADVPLALPQRLRVVRRLMRAVQAADAEVDGPGRHLAPVVGRDRAPVAERRQGALAEGGHAAWPSARSGPPLASC
jgi:hypothetical protein